MNQPGFPDDINAFRLNVVAWRGTRWREHHLEVSSQSLKQALALARHDVQEMTWLSRWANADPTLMSLPLRPIQATAMAVSIERVSSRNRTGNGKRQQENAQAKPSHRSRPNRPTQREHRWLGDTAGQQDTFSTQLEGLGTSCHS